MNSMRIVSDHAACRELWERLWPQQCVFDLWPVRDCFARHFKRPSFFLTGEAENRLPFLLALSWIEEDNYFGHFPGETWQGKTWLEQNKIIGGQALSPETILNAVDGKLYVRYLDADFMLAWGDAVSVDETGYLLLPPRHDFSFDAYRQLFPGKSRKKLDQEIGRFHAHGVSFRYDDMADIDPMMQMNLAAFGPMSYFHDPRFFSSFIDLIDFFKKNNMLRITSVLIGGKLAAVDVGAVWRNTYTVMAGGTNPEFPGVAKLINFHHINWACEQRLASVDFLCGDFSWKSRFRLEERPLYKLCLPDSGVSTRETAPTPTEATDSQRSENRAG